MRKTSGSLHLLLITVCALSLSAVESPRRSSNSHTFESSAAASHSYSSQETGGEITKANWQQHPKIKAIRTIVQSVKTGMTSKRLTTKKRSFEYCEPGEDTLRVLAIDSHSRARFYQTEGGSEDSSLKFEHYYDEQGRLRFVFITGGAVNGSQMEHRIYFDETGKRIWEEQTLKKGPGYTWPEVWPDDQMQINDPAAKFTSKSSCPEIKPGIGKRKPSGK
ncbi:MAG TPA: hypothetical protein VM095_06880 [Pyrinomonadaceae bacterium]|nr:hypothetical protein [Pyrinomonadaceae bacterium]